MGEKGYNPNKGKGKKNEQPKFVSTGLTLEEFLAQSGNGSNASAPHAPRQMPPQYQGQRPRPGQPVRSAYASPYRSAEVATPQHNRLTLSKRQKLGLTALIAGGALFAGYTANVGDVQNAFSFVGGGESANTFVISPNQQLGEKSLAPTQCDKPEDALLVVTVSGDLPLVPQLADATHPTPVDQPPYMTKAKEEKLPENQQDKFDKFITKDGYTHAVVDNLPLALHVCEPAKSKAVGLKAGILTIHRPDLEVSFVDPWGEFTTNMPPVTASLQLNSAEDGATDPSRADYMKIPDPIDGFFLGKGKDDAQNKSIDTILAGIKTEAQQQQMVRVILAAAEKGAVHQLDSTALQTAIDNALTQRMVGKNASELSKEKALSVDGNYLIEMKVPTNPTTKLPITSNDPKTGASPLPGINLNHPFHITSSKIVSGSMKKPTFTPTPTPTPTATTTPTPTPTAGTK